MHDTWYIHDTRCMNMVHDITGVTFALSSFVLFSRGVVFTNTVIIKEGEETTTMAVCLCVAEGTRRRRTTMTAACLCVAEGTRRRRTTMTAACLCSKRREEDGGLLDGAVKGGRRKVLGVRSQRREEGAVVKGARRRMFDKGAVVQRSTAT